MTSEAGFDLFGGPAAGGPARTLSERAAVLVGHDVLTGTWPPGARLGIHALSSRYEIGATPLREALSRLVSSGLVAAVGRRGFRVLGISEADLLDITRVRITVETAALRRSMRRGQEDWEAGVLSALYRLIRAVERDPETMREGAPQFDRLHKGFHRSLLAACGSERLLGLHDDLYYQAYRYRRIMMSRFAEHEAFLDAHRVLADLVLSRKFAEAEKEIVDHLGQTLRVVYGRAVPESDGDE